MPIDAQQASEGAHEEQKPRGRVVDHVRVKNVTGSIFENHGANGPFNTVTFERSYKTAEDEYKKSHSYTASDLDNLVEAATQAKAKLTELNQSKGQSR